MEQVIVTLPHEVVEAIDQEARRRGARREALLRSLIEEWLTRRQESSDLLAEGYQTMADTIAALAVDGVPVQQAAAAGVWRWDD